MAKRFDKLKSTRRTWLKRAGRATAAGFAAPYVLTSDALATPGRPGEDAVVFGIGSRVLAGPVALARTGGYEER